MQWNDVRRIQAVSVAALAVALPLSAQVAPGSIGARPSIRITGKVDSKVRISLPGSHPALLDRAVIGQRLSSSRLLPHLKLVLTSSAEQEAALQQLMGEQQDKSSANFHKWLTPETFGSYFGPSQSDIAKVSAWLGDQGLTVESVSKSGRVLTFSGSVGQVEAAFQTEIRAVTLDGTAHFSNTTDLSIPEALAPVVAGVARVNDFFPVRNHSKISTIQLEAAADGTATGNAAPLYGTATSTHYITPGDAAVIYNTTPLTSASTPTDGTGQTIGIIAQSNINLADVQQFRSMFGLKKNDPTITLVGADPGENVDDIEAFLDAEWGGAAAPNAAVNFLVSAPSLEGGGVDGAALYAVENNAVDIISLSYGGGEPLAGPSGAAYWNTLWEQAASQGQTVFVSSGDSGAAGCDSSGNSYASNGYCVNYLGSSNYNVAVGGSIFVDYGPATYWGANGTTIPFANALSYIPEATLNQGRLATYLNSADTGTIAGSGIFSDGGGISIYTPRPSWQTGSGIPTNADAINVYSGTGIAAGSPISGLHRLVPDLVNISANGHDGTLMCASSVCYTTSSGSIGNAVVIGGTSVATPVQAGMQALINQKNGGRQGNILPILYKLANTQYTASTSACQVAVGTASSPAVTLPASTCNFHDITTGGNIVPTASSGTAGIGFSAGVGFDEATGLGSMNVANVANNWSNVSLIATTTTFTLSPTAGVTHGAAQNLAVTVAPSSGSGVPTGDVSLIASTSTPSGPRTYTLNSGTFTGLVSSAAVYVDENGDTASTILPAGNYSVYVHYAGDGTYAPSNSASVPVSIAKETSTTSATSYNITSAGAVNNANTFAYGADVYLDTYVSPASGKGLPTGSVTYTITRNGSSYGSLTTTLDGTGNTYFFAGQAFPSFYLKPNFAALTPGTYSVTVAYAGDNSYSASNTTASFTVNTLTPAVLFAAPANITSGASATFGYRINNPSTSANPNTTANATGTVTFTDTTTATVLGSCTLASASCSFTTTGITANGANSITALYSGDTNYATATNTATVTVGSTTASSVTVTSTGTATVGGIITLRAALANTTATGSVSFYDGNTVLGTAYLSGGVTTLAVGSTTAGYGTLAAGTHTITASYSGDASNASSTGSLSLVIAQSTTSATLSAPRSSTYGQPVAMSVLVTRNPTTGATYAPAIPPTGTVSFYDSAVSTTTPIASGTLSFDPGYNGYYVGTGTVTTLSGGSHTLTATYNGDSNFTASTSSITVPVTVAAQTPTIMLTSSASTYTTGSPVYLTATIPAASALAVPSGALTFTETASGATYTNTLTYSAAAGGFVSTINLGGLAGTHTYTVTLAADSNYNRAVSNPLTLLVSTNNVWIANGNGTVSGLSTSGTAVASGVAGGGTAVAIDNAGDVWSLNKSASSVSEFSNTGTLLSAGSTVGGLNAPTALAIDGAGLVWVTNNTGTLSVLSAPATAVSPTAYQVSASAPTSLNIDAAGNLWITNAGNNSVTEVIGAAAPVTTPTTNAVKANILATRP